MPISNPLKHDYAVARKRNVRTRTEYGGKNENERKQIITAVRRRRFGFHPEISENIIVLFVFSFFVPAARKTTTDRPTYTFF